MSAARRFFPSIGVYAGAGELVGVQLSQKLSIDGDKLVGDRHRLPVHILGRVGDADVVAQALAHLLDAVGADEERHEEHLLGTLPFDLLKLAPEQVVEALVGAPELDVGAHHHRSRKPGGGGKEAR